jgi:hypothetical protein
MSCCGSRRKAHKAWLISRPVRLRYVGEQSAQVIGNATGTTYSFTSMEREADVDARDAPSLLQTKNFLVAPATPSSQIAPGP